MSFSHLWRFFKGNPAQPSIQSRSRYELVDPIDDHVQEIELSQIDTSSGINPNDVTIEELDLQVENNVDTIHAWQVVRALSTIIFAAENRPQIFVASLLTTLNTALNYVAPFLLGKMIDPNDRNLLGYEVDTVTLTLMLIAAGTLNQYLPNLRDRMLAPVSANNTRQLMTQISEHQLNKSLDYHTKTQFGDQIYLVQKGFSSAGTGMPLLTQIAPAIFEIAMAIGILSSRYGYGMGVGLAATATLYTAYTRVTTPAIINAREEQRKKGNIAWEKISGVMKQYKNIHDFGHYEYEMKAVHKAVTDIAQAEINAVRTSLKIDQGHIAIPRFGMLAACLYVAYGLSANTFTQQDFILIVAYLDKLSTLLPSVGKALNDLFSAWPDLKFVFTELAKPSEIEDPYPTVPLRTNGLSASIRFENVTFGYPNKPPIFRDLSFEIKSGETVAFVSQSGGGKSTLFKLLFRYNLPSEGKIYINDQDISQVSLKSLRENIGLIAQSPNLFNGSVRDNIRYGAPNPDAVTDADIWELAKKANLTEFLNSLDRGYNIELTSEKPKTISDDSKIFVYLENDEPMYALKIPSSAQHPHGGILYGRLLNSERVNSVTDEKRENDDNENLVRSFHEMLQEYPFPIIDKDSKDKLLDLLLERNRISEKRLDNSVGEDGKALSGGEQQRVAILRGLLKLSVIRPFDEITSALDVMTADKALAGIHDITQDQTKLIITHKLSEAQSADTIIVIHKGKVIAHDTHDALLNSCELYKTLWDAQNKKASIDEDSRPTARSFRVS